MNLVLFGSSAQGFMTIQVGPFSALKKEMINIQHPLKLFPSIHWTQIVWSIYSLHESIHISQQVNYFPIRVGAHLTTPLCSGILACWVDIPARKQVEPLRLAQRTLTKSLGPTTLPGVSAATSWVTIVSWPIFWRICGITLWKSMFLDRYVICLVVKYETGF